MTPLPRRCCPTRRRRSDGWLAIGGCRIDALAASSARRCSCTTRPTCGPAAARRSPPSPDGAAYATKAFLCRAMARLAHEEGMRSTWPPAASCTWRWPPACPADRLVLHGNNKSEDELRRAREVGVGRIVVDSFDELDRLERLHAADGLARPTCCCGSRPGSRPTPTSSCAPARSTRSSASAWQSARPRRAVRAGASGHPPSTWSACTCTSAARSSWPTSSTRRSRCWPRSCTRARAARAVDRRRARCRLRRGRGGADDHASGRASVRRRVRRRRHHGPRSRPSRAGRSWPPPRSRSTRWARSRTCPASAPTSPSTAA